MTRPLIYVAGPYSADPVSCTHTAVWTAGQISFSLRASATPAAIFVPHVSMLSDIIMPQPYGAWLELDFAIVERSTAVVRLPGVSPGADRECALAVSLSIPVVDMRECGLGVAIFELHEILERFLSGVAS